MIATDAPRFELRDLTLDTFHDCIALTVTPEQGRFVASYLLMLGRDHEMRNDRIRRFMIANARLIDADNEAAMRLHTDFGFKPTGDREHNEIVMRLSFPQSVEERRI